MTPFELELDGSVVLVDGDRAARGAACADHPARHRARTRSSWCATAIPRSSREMAGFEEARVASGDQIACRAWR